MIRKDQRIIFLGVGPERYPEKCGGSTKQICNCDIMSARAALALFGMGSMRAHEADLISLDPLSNK